MAYRRPLATGAVTVGDDDGAFSRAEEFDGYQLVLGAKPVTVTRYQPMERKY